MTSQDAEYLSKAVDPIMSPLLASLLKEKPSDVSGFCSKYFSSKNRVAELENQLALLSTQNSRGGAGFPQGSPQEGKGMSGLVIKVNHISRICASAEASRAFYMDVCGATLLNRPNFPSPGFWLWLGNVQLHLIQGKNASEEASHAAGVATGNVNHVSFEVYDFDAVEANLKKMGVPFKKNRVPEGGAVIHQLFLQDPDGHYVEICDCNRFSDFVFGPKPDPSAAKELASSYLEGVDPTGATVAAVAALAFLPGQGPDNESLGYLHNCFQFLSKGDDSIDSKDLGDMLKRMGQPCSPDEVAALVKTADADGTGKISYAEFVKMMAPRLKPGRSNAELQAAFDVLDRDGSGHVTEDELLLMLWGMGQRMDEGQLKGAIKGADKNGDGQVNFNEFLALLSKMSS